MKNSKISEAYSEALINIATKRDILIKTLPDIRLFYEVITKDYIHSVANNGTHKEKKSWLDEVFKEWMPDYWMTLMYLLVDKNMFHIIRDITIDFLERGYEKTNVSFGRIYTAVFLSNEELNTITNRLQKKLGRRVYLAQEIDEHLIAGIKVEIENKIYDNSLLGQIRKLRGLIMKSFNEERNA